VLALLSRLGGLVSHTCYDARQLDATRGPEHDGPVTSGTTTVGADLQALADLMTPMAIRVAATLRLADHIASGTRTAASLAAALDADADALERVMDRLVAAGVLTRTEQGDAYELTALGEGLRDDSPGSARQWLDIEGALGRAELCFVELLHTVITGEPAYPRHFGQGFWDDLSGDPDRGASFDALMGARLAADAPAVAQAYPWATLGHVVDVGGGNGTLLLAILRTHPELRGTVVELAGPAARAASAINDAGLGDRADTHVGSFFDPLPPGAGGYVLSGVLHDWDDKSAVAILCRCAEAAGTGTVLVVDHFGDPVSGGPDSEGALRMLCYVRGRERGLPELAELARSAGLEVDGVRPAGSRSLVELRRAA